MPRIRAVFFDAIGTLLFPSAPIHHTYGTFASQHGINVDLNTVKQRIRDAYLRQEQYDEARNWTTSEAREEERWRAVVFESLEAEHEDCFRAIWNWYANPAAWQLHPETETVLRELQARGIVVGMGSNLDRRLESLLAAFPELAPLRERCVISSLAGHRKPAAAFFTEVVRVAGCQSDEMLFVGDDVRNDFDGANAAGLQGLLLNPASVGERGHIRSLGEVPFFVGL